MKNTFSLLTCSIIILASNNAIAMDKQPPKTLKAKRAAAAKITLKEITSSDSLDQKIKAFQSSDSLNDYDAQKYNPKNMGKNKHNKINKHK